MSAVVSPSALPRPPVPAEELAPDLRRIPGVPGRIDLLGRLEGLCAERGLSRLALEIAELMELIGSDLATFESQFAKLPRYPHLVVGRSAEHLLDLGGKRLRPMCVALASRIGTGFDERALDIAVAVELVHSATLLHDDVVDSGDTRRGAATSRALYGNAASIFGGDWVLIEALRRVHRSRLPGLMDDLFETIEEMIIAESLQLENRGRLSTGRDIYFRVVQGKTASLFRWAMSAGGLAGGLDDEHRLALSEYGLHLGIAFQAVDDLLDLTGDAARTGKELFNDLRDGKMTYPVIVALEREPALRPLVEEIVTSPFEASVPDPTAARVIEILTETRAAEDCLAFARERSERAIAALEPLATGAATRALVTVAHAIVDRDL